MGRYNGKTCRLLCMLSMTASYFLVEIVVGYVTNSLALVGDSYHMLSDVVALIVGFASVRISKMDTPKNTFGWARAEVLGALVNAVFLIALCFTIFVEALQRLFHDEHLHDPNLMLIVGSLGLVINLVGLALFHGHGHGHSHGGHGHSHQLGGHGHDHDEKNKAKRRRTPSSEEMTPKVVEVERAPSGPVSVDNGHSHGGSKKKAGSVDGDQETTQLQANAEGIPNGSTGGGAVQFTIEEEEVDIEEDNPKPLKLKSSAQLNMKGVFLHVLGDALGSVIVIISALVIKFAEGEWKHKVDPAMSIVMVIIICTAAVPLLKESSFILLQHVPQHLKVKDLEEKLKKQVPQVEAIHEFHIWQLAGNRIIASLHIRCQNMRDYMEIAAKVKTFFHNEGIHSTTVQPEFIEMVSATDSGDRRPSINQCLIPCLSQSCRNERCCIQRRKSMDTQKRLQNKHNRPQDKNTGCRLATHTRDSTIVSVPQVVIQEVPEEEDHRPAEQETLLNKTV